MSEAEQRRCAARGNDAKRTRCHRCAMADDVVCAEHARVRAAQHRIRIKQQQGDK